jgi:predicted transcriptional regulator
MRAKSPGNHAELPILPRTEFRIVLALNRLGPASARDLAIYLKDKNVEILRETVHKLLERLEEKGLVSGRRNGTSVVWSVDPKMLPRLLQAEAVDVIQNRYDSDPVMLQALITELKVVTRAMFTDKGRPQSRPAAGRRRPGPGIA